MKKHAESPRVAAALCLLATLTSFGTNPTQAQTAPAATVSAQVLAKYDTNKNGVLDPDELVALRADEAKAANTTVATNEAAAAQQEEAIQLSPFEVNAGNDRGYAAQNSLAGTRLNSKLEDIAGSISVVTKQQLMDTAAIDINDIFLNETGTEGTMQFTDLTNDGRGEGVWDNVAGNPTGANRMRGLSSANIAVGGFTASGTIPVDTYNIDAVEIARGPNSNLAGLSDAGGTVNLITSRGNTSRATSRVEGRVDSYGGFRASIDLNRPIYRDKLAVRISAVYNEVGYIRKPSVDRTNRQQVAVTYRPFKSTTISASLEHFHEFAQRANSITPRDTISRWRAAGSPTYDPIGHTYTVNGVRSAAITNINQLPTGLTGLGSSNARILEAIDDGDIKYLMRGAAPTNTIVNTNTLTQFVQSSNVSTVGPLYKIAGTTNKSIYDWTKYNLAASGFQIQRATILNANLDQSLINTRRQRLDFNAAWRREDQMDYRRQFIGQLDGVGTTLVVDANERLLDGRPNPFYLRPFIGGVNPQAFRKPVFNDNYRSQLAYQLDLRREPNLLKWLGMHRAVGYGEYRMTIGAPSNLRYHDTVVDNVDFQPALATLGPTTNISNNNGALLYPLYYFGKTPGGGVEYANSGPRESNGKYVASYLSATMPAWNYNDPVTLQEVYFALGTQKKKVRTTGGSVQSFFWNDRIVTTVGQRRDRVSTRDNLATPALNGFLDETNLWNYGGVPRYRFGDTKTKGVIVRPFRSFKYIDNLANSNSAVPRLLGQTLNGLQFQYNKSDSFQPADTAYNLYLQELPNPTGRTEEYGLGLTLFDNRFAMRLTHQETTQYHTRAGTGVIATRALAIDFDNSGQNLSFGLLDLSTGWWQQIHPEWTLAQAQTKAATDMGYSMDYINSASGKSISDASDAISRGWELELNFNPTRYWTFRMTGNKQEAIDQNISLFMQQFINQRLPFWTTVRVPTDKLPDGSQLPSAGELWWTLSSGSNGMPVNYFTGNVQQPLNLAIATQGKKKPQTREYRFSAVTKYNLAGLGALAESHPWMRSTSVGGSFRWASKGAIGYLGAAPDPDGVVRSLDKTKPVYDKPQPQADLLFTYSTRLFNNRIRADFQLNIRNVAENGKLLGVAVNPDGTPYQYRIVDPRQFILTTSFSM